MEEKEKKKFNFNHHYIFAAILVIILSVCIIRLIQWNGRSHKVDVSDIKKGDAEETLDFYVYPPEDYGYKRTDNGIEDIVIFGNILINSNGAEHSILNIMRDKLDANIIDLSVDKSILASRSLRSSFGQNCFSLYHLTNSIVNQYFYDQEVSDHLEEFATEERYEEFMGRLKSVNMMDVDTVIIMYSLQDYYATIPPIYADEHNMTGYLGALLSTVELIQEKYPHIQIIISSPVQVYYYDDDGNIALGNVTSYGWGNTSLYYEDQYSVATRRCVSFIDNYSYVINDENITEYSEGMWLNDKGIDLVANHIVDFIKNKGLIN